MWRMVQSNAHHLTHFKCNYEWLNFLSLIKQKTIKSIRLNQCGWFHLQHDSSFSFNNQTIFNSNWVNVVFLWNLLHVLPSALKWLHFLNVSISSKNNSELQPKFKSTLRQHRWGFELIEKKNLIYNRIEFFILPVFSSRVLGVLGRLIIAINWLRNKET